MENLGELQVVQLTDSWRDILSPYDYYRAKCIENSVTNFTSIATQTLSLLGYKLTMILESREIKYRLVSDDSVQVFDKVEYQNYIKEKLIPKVSELIANTDKFLDELYKQPVPYIDDFCISKKIPVRIFIGYRKVLIKDPRAKSIFEVKLDNKIILYRSELIEVLERYQDDENVEILEIENNILCRKSGEYSNSYDHLAVSRIKDLYKNI